MKKINTLLVVLSGLTLSTQAFSGEVGVLNVFVAGEPAVAAEVNDNFDAVVEAVNDNAVANGAAAAGLNTSTALNATDQVVRTLTVQTQSDGLVIFNSTAWFTCTSSTTCIVRCSINPGNTNIDTSRFSIATVPDNQYQTLAITGSLPITVNTPLTLNMVCDTFAGSGSLGDANITTIFSAVDVEQP